MSVKDAVIYATSLIGTELVFSFYINCYLLYVLELGLKSKIACNSLFYRKCLKLNQSSVHQCAGGHVITLMTNDVLQLDYSVDILIIIIAGIFQSIIITYIMYREIGVAAVFGATVFFILVPIQGESLSF